MTASRTVSYLLLYFPLLFLLLLPTGIYFRGQQLCYGQLSFA